ncbi:Predicted PurR-regulated permease PerM [Solimonas aquatica]|uniref:Predicted PurR-regulated permease PerM n=1 Tax=Solimonas aquatica TaxID=489703 RepID=A0A1H9MAC7_9GAMM|nr:AI-2E family transporter [Solimonas aquatica]SER20656.1 Predicted PurR-regulated permease PerM [Solimonas aquatica]
MNDDTFPQLGARELLPWLVAIIAAVLVLELRLLSALLAGLLVFELVNVLTPRLRLGVIDHDWPRLLAVSLIAAAVIAALVGLGLGLVSFLRNSSESFPLLLQRMAEIIETARARLPQGLLAYVPEDATELQARLVDWLRTHAGSLQLAGRDFGRSFVHVLMGMIVGALLSLQKASGRRLHRPLASLLEAHALRLSQSFRRVVFAQFTISSINTFFTWLYLDVALPLFGIDLPLAKTLVAITFVFGLLPILGNLISNTAIVIVSLSQGLPVASISLLYLVTIHKLEYFLNARIIGSHINARAWELLIAMLVMEAAFGLSGLIAAPIFYAYFKEELRAKGLV